jgi:Kef-type K+ transport system membrane component KefB
VDTLTTATIAALLILVASMLSVELALSAAILEIVLGVFAGNVLHLATNAWIDFLAGFAGILLTFLAGAEVDPSVLRGKWRQAAGIGGLSFVVGKIIMAATFVTDLCTVLALSALFITPNPFLLWRPCHRA